MTFVSPYPRHNYRPYKGNLHTHTTESDGAFLPQKTVDYYAEMGHHFLMLSDHDLVTDISRLDPRGMTLIPGNEITAGGVHLLHVQAQSALTPTPERQPMIDAINADGGIAIMNHPNWGADFIHCRQQELEALTGYTGIEIYNGVSERAEGAALATDRWDMLLSQGRQVWGFGNDDCHESCDFGIAWNVVFAESAAAPALIDAMRLGNFYVSTGVEIDSIIAEGDRLRIHSQETQCFRIVRDHGMILAEVEGSALDFQVPDCAPLSYVRVECYGRGARMAWTQPFRVA